WGDDRDGQLGRGTASTRAAQNSVPQLVALTSVAHVGAGAHHTCAALTNGDAWCWGKNDAGQIGTTPSVGSAAPVSVVTRAGLQARGGGALGGGASHTCAIKSDATLLCWGSDGSGELGDGATAASAPATAVASLGAHVLGVGAGLGFSCAALDNKTVSCWGADG